MGDKMTLWIILMIIGSLIAMFVLGFMEGRKSAFQEIIRYQGGHR